MKKIIEKSHLLLLIGCVWLFASKWQVLIGASFPKKGFFNYAHIIVGLFVVLFSFLFLYSYTSKGKWKSSFYWITFRFNDLFKDIKLLFRGKIPDAGGQGLFTLIESITLILLIAVGITGVMWLFTSDSLALEIRGYHKSLSYWLFGFIMLHIIAVISHIRDFF